MAAGETYEKKDPNAFNISEEKAKQIQRDERKELMGEAEFADKIDPDNEDASSDEGIQASFKPPA